jgi:hypothetical protein
LPVLGEHGGVSDRIVGLEPPLHGHEIEVLMIGNCYLTNESPDTTLQLAY